MFRRETPRIVIVGAGISGLCLAIRLKQAGFDHLTILEKSDEVGGTWLKNTYPNAGCDVPSYLYCYSFAPNYRWTTKYARQPEILAYLKSCADRFGVRPHIRFGTSVESAEFDEESNTWRIRTDSGEELVAEIFVSAVGQLNRPKTPPFDGLDRFGGAAWHSARWNHDYDLTDRTVAVVGNGASAIQFLPEVARKAKKTYLFQRSPCWIQPLHNYRYPAWAQWGLRFAPLCARLHRLWIYLTCECRILAFREGSWLHKEYERRLRRQMRRQIPRRHWPQLIPEYSPGCKRILLSNDYLQTLARDDVEVVSDAIQRVENDSIVTASETKQVDAVIFATGFKTNEFLQPMEIRGRGGQRLDDAWEGRPKALYGLATPGFPNLFMLYGPNTNLGHNSIIFMVQRQVDYLVRCLRRLNKLGAQTIEVTREAMDRYDQDVQTKLKASVWAGDCSSWYKSADGSIPNNWWGSATAYWLCTRRPKFSDFRFSGDRTEIKTITPQPSPPLRRKAG